MTVDGSHGDGYCGCTERCRLPDNCQYNNPEAKNFFAASHPMTQRDDLVSRLREKVFFSDEVMAARMPHDEEIIDRYRTERKDAATALEAKDAEIARLRQELAYTKDDMLRRHKDAVDRFERIAELERQLAENGGRDAE